MLLNPLWKAIPHASGETYAWSDKSTYIKAPPFLDARYSESGLREFRGARALAILGNSITTDHISPISSIKASSTAGLYLQSLGVAPADFNNYGARRMNHEVMVRGAFANVRLRNQMVPGVEGGYTVHQPGGEQMAIYDAAMRYEKDGVPLLRDRGRGIRHRQRARLGRQRHATARRARRDRRELRAHTPQQSGRHGRVAVPVAAGRYGGDRSA